LAGRRGPSQLAGGCSQNEQLVLRLEAADQRGHEPGGVGPIERHGVKFRQAGAIARGAGIPSFALPEQQVVFPAAAQVPFGHRDAHVRVGQEVGRLAEEAVNLAEPIPERFLPESHEAARGPGIFRRAAEHLDADAQQGEPENLRQQAGMILGDHQPANLARQWLEGGTEIRRLRGRGG
jgi:hypothetical protein